MNEIHQSQIRQRFPWWGLIAVVLGLGLVFFEIQTNYLLRTFDILVRLGALVTALIAASYGFKLIFSYLRPNEIGRGYQFRLPVEGGVFLLLSFVFFVGAIVTRSNLLMMLFSINAGAFLINGWMTFTMLQGARTTRSVPQLSMAGEPVSISVDLENRLPWLSLRLMTVRDTIAFKQQVIHPEILFLHVLPKSHRTGVYLFEPEQRGKYSFERIGITTRFPLGLVQRGRGRDVPESLLVYPRSGYLLPGWKKKRNQIEQLTSRSKGNVGNFQEEFHQLREYRIGDDRRTIHWRTSARMNELMVSEFQEVRESDLVLVVDASLAASTTSDSHEQLELGLRFVTTVIFQMLQLNRNSALFVELLGEKKFYWYGDVTRDPESLLSELALLQPSLEDHVKEIRQILEKEQNRSRQIVILTLRPDKIEQLLANWEYGTLPFVQILEMSSDGLRDVFADSERSHVKRV